VAEDSVTLLDVVRKEGDGDLVRGAVRWFVRELMEAEATAVVGAGPHERTEERTTHRDGHRTRRWDTRVGTLDLQIPQAADRALLPELAGAAQAVGAGAGRGRGGGVRQRRQHPQGRGAGAVAGHRR